MTSTEASTSAAPSPANRSTPPSSIFGSFHTTIREGDVVIAYFARDNLQAFTVKSGQHVASRFGHFMHDDIIGTKFGTKFASKNGKGFTYLLRPTPELWSLALPHRTQILYLPDIAYIISQLDIKPGSRVIEAGTGSGSFSHSVARSVGPKGYLYSFEYHEDRFKQAQDEFRRHGLLCPEGVPIVLQHRDIIKNGFGALKDVDSIFLDVPAPWDALEHARAVMNRRNVSRICCFSPCIEQVQRTVATLNALGFSDIAMYETLIRTHEGISVTMPTIEEAAARISEVEVRKEGRRQRQIQDAKRKRETREARSAVEHSTEMTEGSGAEAAENSGGEGRLNGREGDNALTGEARKRIRGEDDTNDATDDRPAGKSPVEQTEGNSSKRVRLETNPAQPITMDIDAGPDDPSAALRKSNVRAAPEPSDPPVNGADEAAKIPAAEPEFTAMTFQTSRPVTHPRGHTSFLTFAVLLPDLVGTMTSREPAETVEKEAADPEAATAPKAPLEASRPSGASNATAETSFALGDKDVAKRPLSGAELAMLAEAEATAT